MSEKHFDRVTMLVAAVLTFILFAFLLSGCENPDDEMMYDRKDTKKHEEIIDEQVWDANDLLLRAIYNTLHTIEIHSEDVECEEEKQEYERWVQEILDGEIVVTIDVTIEAVTTKDTRVIHPNSFYRNNVEYILRDSPEHLMCSTRQYKALSISDYNAPDSPLLPYLISYRRLADE